MDEWRTIFTYGTSVCHKVGSLTEVTTCFTTYTVVAGIEICLEDNWFGLALHKNAPIKTHGSRKVSLILGTRPGAQTKEGILRSVGSGSQPRQALKIVM